MISQPLPQIVQRDRIVFTAVGFSEGDLFRLFKDYNDQDEN